MPNHITNKLKINGSKELVKEIKDYLKTEYDEGIIGIDFNKIIPMPKSLDITSGSIEDRALSLFIIENPECERKVRHSKEIFIKDSKERILDYLKSNDEMTYSKLLELGQKYYENILEYGYSTWYDWCIANWGTKWNAYECDIEDTEDTIYFCTAWRGVPVLIEMLSVRFPEVEFEYYYADEDFGNNVGAYTFKNGEKAKNIPENRSKEAYDLACEIMNTTLKEHCINENYEYDESLEES